MKNYPVILVFFLSVFCALPGVNAQVEAGSPWETCAPAGSLVFTDLKTALKDPSQVYRLQLTGTEFLKDKKLFAKIPKLTSTMGLQLVNNDFTVLPSPFLQMQGLVYFSSTGNPFTSLPDSLGLLGNIRYMQLAGTHFDTLPAGIADLYSLKTLVISSNADTLHITKTISALKNSLNTLVFYNTKLDTLPAEFSSLDALNLVTFYKCSLNKIPKPVLHLSNLHMLCLDSNNLTVLPKSLYNMQTLTYLSLRGNHIKHISDHICFMQNLTTLDLTGNPIDPYEIEVLKTLLPHCAIIF